MDHKPTITAYWNQVFEKWPVYNPSTPLPYPELEDALNWLADCHTILDFGCGTGRALFRALALGAKNGVGIDLSEAAIAIANTVADNNDLRKRCRFSCGSTSILESMPVGSCDGAILFNIIDNMTPEQGIAVLNEVHRILVTGSKVLLKLNNYLQQDELAGHLSNYVQLGPDLYQEASGLLLWNLSTAHLLQMLKTQFALHNSVDVLFPDYGQVNRLFFFTTV